MKLYGLKFKHSVQKYFLEITLKNNINRSKNEAKNLQFFCIYAPRMVDSPCLNCCSLESMTRKLPGF